MTSFSRHQSPLRYLIHMWFMFFHELWSLVLIWLLKNKQRKLTWKLYSAYSGMLYQSRILFYKVSKKSISFSFCCDQWKMRFSILLFKGNSPEYCFIKFPKSLYRFHFVVISEKWGFPFFYLKVIVQNAVYGTNIQRWSNILQWWPAKNQ